jgi:hypothetical protein
MECIVTQGMFEWLVKRTQVFAGTPSSAGTIDTASIKDNNTYYTNEGKPMVHIVNRMAGNIESHSTLSADQPMLDCSAVLNIRD